MFLGAVQRQLGVLPVQCCIFNGAEDSASSRRGHIGNLNEVGKILWSCNAEKLHSKIANRLQVTKGSPHGGTDPLFGVYFARKELVNVPAVTAECRLPLAGK